MYAYLNEWGVPCVIASTREAAGMTPVPPGVDPDRMMCPKGIWEPRPAAGHIQAKGNVLTLQGLPEGAHLEVVDVLDNVVLFEGLIGPDEEVCLSDPGRYQIELTLPMPWLGGGSWVSDGVTFTRKGAGHVDDQA